MTVLAGQEIQPSPFGAALRLNLLSVLENDFFARLARERVPREGYRFFVREKYSSVAYFPTLLENAEWRLRPVSPELAEAVRNNRLDETGHFAGEVREAYRHENWRIRSLALFGVRASDLTILRLSGSRKHEAVMRELAASEDPFELAGALLFLELFVVYEMKALIAAFERDLPDLFPPGGYSYDRFPFNPQEYWYGHALHDTWHFRSIEEPLRTMFRHEGSGRSLGSLHGGIEKVAAAKQCLYSPELFDSMASLPMDSRSAMRPAGEAA